MEPITDLIGRILSDCAKNDKEVCSACVLDIYKDHYCGCSGTDSLKAIQSIIRRSTLTVKEQEVQGILCKYDDDADVLYINFFNSPLKADDSFTVGDLLIRLLNGKPIGVTLLYFKENQGLITKENEK